MYPVKSDPHSSGEVWRALRAAAPQTVPVFAGYLVLGMGYGIYVQSLGLPVWMPMLMGTVVYGGSLEFVLASLLLGAFAPLSAFLMALMIQARHLFYGLAMLERYKGYGLRSVYMIYAMSDETFSITCACGNVIKTRSTKPEIHVEVCSKCHPFYTGKQKLVDSGGRVERFNKRFGRK